jgi:hypothetical protein
MYRINSLKKKICKLLVDYDTVQSSPGSRGVEPGPAGPSLKNIGTGLDWKPGRSGPGTRRAAKPAKYAKKRIKLN